VKNGVKNVQAAAYNSACTVHIYIKYQFGCGILKVRFLAKNQYTQRKPLYFENTGSASLSKIGHDFRK
jgi:hypothetical protein